MEPNIRKAQPRSFTYIGPQLCPKWFKWNPIYVKLHFYLFTYIGSHFCPNLREMTKYEPNIFFNLRPCKGPSARPLLFTFERAERPLHVQASGNEDLAVCCTWNLLILAIWCRFRLCDNFQPPCFIALEPFHHGLFDGISDQFGPFKEIWLWWLFSASCH